MGMFSGLHPELFTFRPAGATAAIASEFRDEPKKLALTRNAVQNMAHDKYQRYCPASQADQSFWNKGEPNGDWSPVQKATVGA